MPRIVYAKKNAADTWLTKFRTIMITYQWNMPLVQSKASLDLDDRAKVYEYGSIVFQPLEAGILRDRQPGLPTVEWMTLQCTLTDTNTLKECSSRKGCRPN